MKFIRSLVGLVCAIALGTNALAQQREAGSVRGWEHEVSDLEVDPRIHFGHLENGLRFAWIANREPQERCYVRLHVDIGALVEEDDENGMAHFLEHMAFNGSRNFAAGTLIEWFQENGMAFGADLNASTNHSETVYKLDLPHADAETLREGLTVLRDWADGMLLDSEEINKEKGVIDGEEAAGDTAGRRVFDRILVEQYPGTRYLIRDVIGEKDVRAAFTAEGTRAFYERWYRPEVMTLVIVGDLGDLDPKGLIEELFADLTAPARPVEPEPSKGEATIEERFFSIHEPELPSVSVYMQMLHEYEEEPDTVATRTKDMDLSCARRMLNLRFGELAKKEGAPFLSARAHGVRGLEIYDGETLSVNAEPEKWEFAFAAAEYELRRALVFGFQQAELDEVRAGWLRSLEEAVERESTRHSRRFVRELLHAAEERAVPTNAAAADAMLRPVIEALTVEACHEAFVEAWNEGALNLFTAGKLDLGDDAERTLAGALERARGREVEEGVAIETSSFAYASDPQAAGKFTAENHVEDLDVWQFTFENGVRLNVKQTDFKERQIMVSARVAEGLLTLPPEDYAIGWVATQAAMNLAGLGAHTQDELRRLAAGKTVGVGFGWSDDAFTLNGATTAGDLLFQLELLCAQLQDPGWRDDGIRMVRDRTPLIFERLAHVPNGPLILDFLPEVFHGDARFTELPERGAIEQVEMEQIKTWIAPHLSNGPIEVTIVGDLDVELVKTATARTLGALPARRARAAFSQHRTVAPAKSGVRMEREIDTEDNKSLVFLIFPTTDGLDTERRRELTFLGQVVQDRLRLEVRERLGAAYSPGASSEPSRTFPGIGTLTISAQADPDKVPTLVEACLAVANDLHENGVTAEEVARLAEPIIARVRDQKRTNDFWVGTLGDSQERPVRLDDIRNIEAWYRDVDADKIGALAKRYLDREAASVLVVNPATARANVEAKEAAVAPSPGD